MSTESRESIDRSAEPAPAGHYHNQKNRTFVRSIQGEYNLTEELRRLRSMPQAGDVVVVHNNCVHQHFNASNEKPARALVIKTKPMFMFMNMLFQKQVIPRPAEPAPGGEHFSAREDEIDYNHPDGGY